MMFKKGERTDLKNYRPLSLSNVDYRILAFTLSKRVHKILDKIISPEQTAYVKNRFIGENIRQMHDIIDYAYKMKIPGIILFLDFQKAFDSLEWNFMFKTLKKFGFGSSFIKWIQIIYTNTLSSIKINGFLTTFIKLMRSVKQGCPLSALIFIICVEILAIAIKNNQDIQGIIIANKNKIKKTIKLSQYADDTSLYLKNAEQIIHALDTVIEFGSVSGLKLNLDKTEALSIGILIGKTFKINGINWAKHPIRYLGIYIGINKRECEILNWDNKLESFQKLLDCWRIKNMTIFSKINYIKTFALSRINFVASMLEVPCDFIKKIDKIIYSFIWGKRDKIRRRSLICPLEEGGLNMLDSESHFLALKAAWVYRLTSCNKPWNFIGQSHLKSFAPNCVLLNMSFSELKQMPCLNMIPKFYQEVLLGCCKSNHPTDINSKISLYKQSIWGNRLIKNNNTCLYNSHWIVKGFKFISDILETNGQFKNSLQYAITDKRDYFKTINQISMALRKYKEFRFANDILEGMVTVTELHPYVKSKAYYLKLIHQKKLMPHAITYWKKYLS